MSKLGKRFAVCLVIVLASICIAQEHTGVVLDAMTNHIIVTGGMTPANIAAGERDPRKMQLLRRRGRRQRYERI